MNTRVKYKLNHILDDSGKRRPKIRLTNVQQKACIDPCEQANVLNLLALHWLLHKQTRTIEERLVDILLVLNKKKYIYKI